MIRDHLAEASEMFSSGFNCAQAVALPFCEEYGADRATLLKVTAAFGGGYGGSGRTCGAVTGGLMVIGARYGSLHPADHTLKNIIAEKSLALIECFTRAHGTLMCSELTAPARRQGSDSGSTFTAVEMIRLCPRFLETVIIFLEEEL